MKIEILSKELINSNGKIKFSTRFPNRNPDYDTEEDVSANDEYKDCAVVIDDMLENEQKSVSPFYNHGRHENIDVYG